MQSDENFREMHQLDSDAISDDSYMAERRRGRSREQVEPWRRQQLAHQKLDDPQTPARAARGRNARRSRGHSEGTGVRYESKNEQGRQKSASERTRPAKQDPRESAKERTRKVALGSAEERLSSARRRPIRSRSAPARSNKGKERMRDV